VIDWLPDMISVHRHGALIYLNRAARQLLAITAAEGWQSGGWNKPGLIERVHPDDLLAIQEQFRRLFEAEGTREVPEVTEVRMRGLDNSWRMCEVSGIIVDIAGVPTVIASARDVTERKRLQAKLMVAERMASLGTLAAGIAHEINNPLAYVAGNLEMTADALESPAPPVSELKTVISDARDGAERIRRIVHDLRWFSRAGDERLGALTVPAVLDAAIRLTANEVRHRAQLVQDIGATPPVFADDSRLTQVFINLLVNAAHALPEGHSDTNRITVRTRTDDQGRAVIEIHDTGRGMAAEVQARAFEPFFTTKDIGEGTGLGLSICHGIVTSLSGQISLDSELGTGTTVRVVLPACADLEPPAPVPAPPVVGTAHAEPGEPHRRRVMVVDDEPRVADTIQRLLKRDYDITVALCGREAIEYIQNGARFDAIVSDVMMPNMTGIELLDELQRLAPEQAHRVIFLSGGAFTAQTRERLAHSGARQLEKPVTAKQLRACLAEITAA
jgi:PAS domain S-box-containing protein